MRLVYDFYFFTSRLLPKWSSDLKYGSCPPARDFGSRVSGLVCFIFCHFKRTDLVDVADGVEAFQVVPFLIDYGAAVVVVGGAKSRFS